MGETPRVGVSRIELRPKLGSAMMGYGARQGTATDRHDPLFARALYAEAGGRLLLVEIDVCLVAVAQADALRERIAERTGLQRSEVMVGCIHTHSGPETGLLPVLLGRGTPPEVEPLFDAVVEAGVCAFESAEPARLGVGSVPVCIGRNRRVESGSLDPHAVVARFDRPDGSPLAVLYVHGCHPTVLGHDNLHYSADWPGRASRAVEERLPGALAIFVLGAHADVDPHTRGMLDLAKPGQSVGVGFGEMEALGREVGVAVAECAAALESRADFEVASASTAVPLSVHGAEGREEHLERRRRDALRALALSPDLEPSIAEWYRLEAEHTQGLAPQEVRERASAVRLLLRDRMAERVAQGLRVEVAAQVLRLGPMWLLALPLEATVDVGGAWRRATSDLGAVISIANGWLRYLPAEDHYAEPEAAFHYEILNATFVPSAAATLVSAGLELRSELA